LDVVQLSEKTEKRIQEGIPVEASASNPVDLIATADADRFDHALKAVLADRGVDMVLAIFVSPVMIDAAAVAKVFTRHAKRSSKPIVACLLGKERGFEAVDILADAGVANYRFPEDAATALSGLWKLSKLRSADDSGGPRFRVQKKRGRAAIENALNEGREMLKGMELYELLSSYGIPVVPTRLVRTLDQALKATRETGWPVVLKVEAQGVVHKSDLGGVILDIRTEDELASGWEELESRFRKQCPDMRVLVQSLRQHGIETFMGATTDAQFGRLLAFGLGGIHVEVLKDVVFRLHPLSRVDAEGMVEGIRAASMFEGVRGKPPVDKEQLVEMLLRLDRMLTDCPEIYELDFNPFLAAWDSSESCVLDVRVRLKKS
jgi:acetyltransferase